MKLSGIKRRLAATSTDESQDSWTASPPQLASPASNPASSSSFRNVSACNRCRQRKNRCDQKLPACSSCEKAGIKCVGFDPLTKRAIPRTYVYYLESRVAYLESLLTNGGIPFAPSQDFDLGSNLMNDRSLTSPPFAERSATSNDADVRRDTKLYSHDPDSSQDKCDRRKDEAEKLSELVSNIGMVSVQGASDPRYLGSTSGISFARVVFAAVKSSVSTTTSDKDMKPNKPGSGGSGSPANGTSMRDSFFGLQSKPIIKPAPFPERVLGLRLVKLYFEHANPQIPILHRGEFMTLFDRAYSSKDRHRSPRELYMLNIVFAVGAGIILEDSSVAHSPVSARTTSPIEGDPLSPKPKKQKMSGRQKQPEEYHASAMVHLESFLGSTTAADHGFGGGLEELQAVLLLASFALLRPVAPGLWYITGVAMRLAVDLGLHYEDGLGINGERNSTGTTDNHGQARKTAEAPNSTAGDVDRKERGRREWVRDLRRRLWWCVYSFDRLVSTCVGRPLGITDQVITTDFPSMLDDNAITTSGFTTSSHTFNGPSYKRVSHHYFRLRLLQSEILQVLQHRQAQRVHESTQPRGSGYMHTNLISSFLQPFESFNAWRSDIDRRLWEWKESAPSQADTTVQFSVQFLELNYWQAVIMLYRQSLSVPPTLAGETSPSDDVARPMSCVEEPEDEDDLYLKVAEAGQNVLKLYRQLHRVGLVNYTYLATVHLFMAGIAFLYAIWHSLSVRSRLTLDDVEFTILAATSVLGDLIDKCPPAEACRDAFDRMSKATVQMCLSTSGFGPQAAGLGPDQKQPESRTDPPDFEMDYQTQPSILRTSRPPPQFDMNLRDLFPDELQDGRSFLSNVNRWSDPMQSQISTTQPSQQPDYQDPNFGQQQGYQTDPNQATGASYTMPTTISNTPDNMQGFNGSGNNFDFDFLASNDDSTGVYHGNSGLHLGFHSEHDWADGAQMDLFDGFFFGGVGNAVNSG